MIIGGGSTLGRAKACGIGIEPVVQRAKDLLIVTQVSEFKIAQI